MDNPFGNRLKELRHLRGLTQEQLAEQCNVSTTSISRWELESRRPNAKNQQKLAEVLCVSLDDFYIQLDLDLPKDVLLNEIISVFQKLNPKEQQFILQISKELHSLNHSAD